MLDTVKSRPHRVAQAERRSRGCQRPTRVRSGLHFNEGSAAERCDPARDFGLACPRRPASGSERSMTSKDWTLGRTWFPWRAGKSGVARTLASRCSPVWCPPSSPAQGKSGASESGLRWKAPSWRPPGPPRGGRGLPRVPRAPCGPGATSWGARGPRTPIPPRCARQCDWDGTKFARGRGRRVGKCVAAPASRAQVRYSPALSRACTLGQPFFRRTHRSTAPVRDSDGEQ